MNYKVFYLDRNHKMCHFYKKGSKVLSIIDDVLRQIYSVNDYLDIVVEANKYEDVLEGLYEVLSNNVYSTKLIGIVNTDYSLLEFGEFNPDDYPDE